MSATAAVAALLMLATAGTIRAGRASSESPDRSGRMEARVAGRVVEFPILHVKVDAEIDGDLAIVTTVQEFANPSTEVVDATYLFPLDDSAAINSMELRVGDDVVRARIKRKDEARQEFEQARTEGRGAALVEQHRPNMFTQDVANLVPGLPITVTLRHVQPIPRIDGAYELVLPLVVGPRYVPDPARRESSEREPLGLVSQAAIGWMLDPVPPLPPIAGIDSPAIVEDARVSIAVRINAGLPLREVGSPSHAVDVASSGEVTTVKLAKGTIGNRDFVLRWALASDVPQAGAIAHSRDGDTYVSILVEPPETVVEEQVAPREVVYLLDCSGSMDGIPLDASKEFVRESLAGLRHGDAFRIIRFSDDATEFSSRPLEATEEHVAGAHEYLDSLSGEGGTQMTSGIRQALATPPEEGRLRIVVFLTDGYIGNEEEIFRLVHSLLGDARIFVLGVSTAPNRFLLTELSRIGRGFTRYMDPTDTVEGIATELAEKVDAPVLTDVSIDWGELEPIDVTPERIPDLFAGRSVRVLARCRGKSATPISIEGTIAGRRARLPVTIDVRPEPPNGSPVVVGWARATIADLSADLALSVTQRRNARADDAIREQVVELGLAHSLVTQWTSFVAVTETVMVPRPDGVRTAQVPLPQVEGAPASAYPTAGLRAGSSRVPGAGAGNLFGTPEPEWAGILVLLIAGGLWVVVRRPAS